MAKVRSPSVERRVVGTIRADKNADLRQRREVTSKTGRIRLVGIAALYRGDSVHQNAQLVSDIRSCTRSHAASVSPSATA